MVQEVIHSSMQRGEKGMIVKLDLANDFDRVRHVFFLFQVMQIYGFNASFIQWIKAYIGTPWIAPLVNGRATKFFQATRGSGMDARCPPCSMPFKLSAKISTRTLPLPTGINGHKNCKRSQRYKPCSICQ
jgi:hypothetical protein